MVFDGFPFPAECAAGEVCPFGVELPDVAVGPPAAWAFRVHRQSSGVPYGSPVFERTSGAAQVAVDATNRRVSYSATAAETGTTLGPGQYFWSVWRTDAGNERRHAWGPWVIRA
jgi:hypothetical protein